MIIHISSIERDRIQVSFILTILNLHDNSSRASLYIEHLQVFVFEPENSFGQRISFLLLI